MGFLIFDRKYVADLMDLGYQFACAFDPAVDGIMPE